MKVIVFGGAGDMGRQAVRTISEASDVESLLVADYNEKEAKKVAASLEIDHAEAAFCDANDHNQIVSMMSEADVCLSCVGPFYTYEAKMIRAAIEARTAYVSICDDFDAAEAALALDKSAKKAGIPVLTGMGWTPGLSNVIAAKGLELLDSASEIHIAWVGGADDSEGIAVIKHTLHIFTGEIPTYTKGRWKKVPAGSGKEKVEFPAPVGKISVYNLGHPEPVTIPHFVPGLQEVTLKGACTPEWVNPMAKGLVALGLTNTPLKRDRAASFFHAVGPTLFKSKTEPISGIHVRVIGEKGGAPAKFVGAAVDNMNRLTGIPAAIGTLMLGRKQIEKTGVIAPEICVDPDLFFTEMKKQGIEVETRMER